MNSLLIKNASVVTENTVQFGCSVYCENGTILEICSEPQTITANEVINADGMLLCPGFIDLHIHGIRGVIAESGRGQLEIICRELPRYGVTGFLPAICPTKSGVDDIALLEDLSKVKSGGAEMLGFFLEGHYLALTGAISRIPRIMEKDHVKRLIEAAIPYKTVFAVSPEIGGVTKLLPTMTASGYPAFITHTAATAAQTQAAVQAGAIHATHFYNVFPYSGDREPGVRGCGAVEAILANPDVSVDFILDGEHIDPITVKMALACKSRDKVCLITDANVSAGLPPGRYTGLGGSEIESVYEGGPARLVGGPLQGGLAGSGLTMDKAMKNAVQMLDVSVPQAAAMVSSNPASVLGMKNKGKIAAGCDADFVLVDDEYNVMQTWVGGKTVFVKER